MNTYGTLTIYASVFGLTAHNTVASKRLVVTKVYGITLDQATAAAKTHREGSKGDRDCYDYQWQEDAIHIS